MNTRLTVILIITGIIFFLSCQKNEIDFGSIPENYFTNIIYVDTVEVQLSTVISDSFVTSSAQSFLLGVVNDPELGVVDAKPYFQLGIPTSGASIPENAIYDSVKFIVRLNNYYYGDTTKQKTIRIHELNEDIVYSYNDELYNTSRFEVKPVAIGSYSGIIRPTAEDSLSFQVNDNTGNELFGLLKSKSDIVSSEENFLRYFKGIRFSVDKTDSGSVIGINGSAGTNALRLYYHTNSPYPVYSFIDFPGLANTYAFNELDADRSSTLLAGVTGNGLEVFPSSQTSDKGFMQSGAGVWMKINFPSISNLQLTDDLIRLQKAELILRPVPSSYNGKFPLPPSLYLTHTDATNLPGSYVADSTEQDIQYAAPVIDQVYGLDTYYRFDITSGINSLLASANKTELGFFLLEAIDPEKLSISRAVFGNRNYAAGSAQLRLTIVKINN